MCIFRIAAGFQRLTIGVHCCPSRNLLLHLVVVKWRIIIISRELRVNNFAFIVLKYVLTLCADRYKSGDINRSLVRAFFHLFPSTFFVRDVQIDPNY